MDKFEELKNRQQAVSQNILKGFQGSDELNDYLEKARVRKWNAGDTRTHNGKKQVLVEHKPGKYTWRIVKEKQSGEKVSKDDRKVIDENKGDSSKDEQSYKNQVKEDEQSYKDDLSDNEKDGDRELVGRKQNGAPVYDTDPMADNQSNEYLSQVNRIEQQTDYDVLTSDKYGMDIINRQDSDGEVKTIQIYGLKLSEIINKINKL